jgi:hypothetical protein
MEKGYIPNKSSKVPEARYAYYRRCQVFRKDGEQCKAPAEKGFGICYAHAREQATAFRRKLQLSILLVEVARHMRARGKPEFKIADIFTDFDAIQMTLAMMAQALLDGRIDCKTAGRLAIGLQTAAKLLQLCQRAHRESQKKENLTTKITKEHEDQPVSTIAGKSAHENYREIGNKPGIGKNGTVRHEILKIVLLRIGLGFDRAHAPPEWMKAA